MVPGAWKSGYLGGKGRVGECYCPHLQYQALGHPGSSVDFVATLAREKATSLVGLNYILRGLLSPHRWSENMESLGVGLLQYHGCSTGRG